MKKTALILWIVAALFLVCSVPLFTQGNVGAGMCGIVIAAILFVVGLRKNKAGNDKTAAVPLTPSKIEAPPASQTKEPAETATQAKYEFVKTKVAGVTFKNGRKHRQTILRKIYFKDEPFDKGEMELMVERYEYEGKPAYGVYVNGDQIGNIPAEHTQFITDNYSRFDGITNINVYGGGEDRSYGAEITLRFVV